MNLLNDSTHPLLLPSGPVRLSKRIVAHVELPYPVASLIQKVFSEHPKESMHKLRNLQKSILTLECSIIKINFYGCARYKVSSFILEDTVNDVFLSWIDWLIKHNFINGVLLSGFGEISNIGFSAAIRNLVKFTKFKNMYASTTVVSAQQLSELPSFEFTWNVKRSELLQVDGINQDSLSFFVYGNHFTPIREIIDYRYQSSQFTILSANLKDPDFRDYLGDRDHHYLRSKYLRIVMTEESDV